MPSSQPTEKDTVVDYLVVGGGIVGTGVAHYLTKHGVEDVLLLEAEEYGAGATGGSFGNVRQQFGTPLEVELSRRGLKFWKTIEAEFDSPCTFHQDGYLMVTANADTAAVLEKHAAVQRECGMPDIELLEGDAIRELSPFLETSDLIYGSYTRGDGHVMGMDGIAAYVKAAKAAGARFRQHSPVLSLERVGSTWKAITPQGSVTANTVIITAGGGTKELLAPFGVDLDIRRVSHLSFLTEPAYTDQTVPFTVDLDSGLAVEREGKGFVLAMLGRNPAPETHEELAEQFFAVSERRAPALQNLRLLNQMTAWPTVGGDGHPYVGQVADGLWALAFVGHGIMHGPPLAEAIALEALGMPDPTLDLSAYELRRTPGPRTVLWRRNATN